MRRFDVAERRARLGVRHFLAAPAPDPVNATHGVVVLHATDPSSVFLSLYARTAPVDVVTIERALYEDRSLVRMLGMRRTMFVVPVELVPVVQAAATNEIAARQWRTYVKVLSDAGAGDRAWLAKVLDATAHAVASRGEATGVELSADVPELRTQIRTNEGKAYAATQNITTWVLMLLSMEGRIVRGRPRGSWVSSQYRWAPMDAWLPDGMRELAIEDSRAELVRRWLAAFGPGTVQDLKWWTGWTLGQVKLALKSVQPEEVELDDGTGLALPDDLEPTPDPDPWVSFLPALDATAMGWTDRSWYLADHAAALFDRSGNIGPTVWSDGRIVGGWGQRPDGEVVYRLLEDVGSEKAGDTAAAAERLTTWMAGVRVTPRFRTPLELQLAGS